MRGAGGDRAVETVGHPHAGSAAHTPRLAGRAQRKAWQGQPLARRAGTRHRGGIAVTLDALSDNLASGPDWLTNAQGNSAEHFCRFGSRSRTPGLANSVPSSSLILLFRLIVLAAFLMPRSLGFC